MHRTACNLAESDIYNTSQKRKTEYLQVKLLRAQAQKQSESNLLGLHFIASGYEQADLCCWKWQENARNLRQIPRSSSVAVRRISPLHFHLYQLQSRRSQLPPLPNSTETEEKSKGFASLGSTAGWGGRAFPQPGCTRQAGKENTCLLHSCRD